MGDPDVLLRRAHEAGYRFPQGFAGFSASVRTGAGDSGRLVVRGRTEIELTFAGEPSDDASWARDEVASIVSHRWPSGYEEGDGRWAKRADGEMVTILDDPFDSAYKLRDNVISEVHRTVGVARFVIAVSERLRTADGRQLPTHFTVFYWDTGAGRLTRADHFTDTYTVVRDVYLPQQRRVVSATDGGIVTRVLELADHAVDTDA
jgi:hypothetical protein